MQQDDVSEQRQLKQKQTHSQQLYDEQHLQQQDAQEKANYFASEITQIYAERHWSEQLLNDEKVFLFVLSAHGDILYCSSSCRGLTGHSADDVVGHLISDFLHPDDHTVFYEILDKVFETPLRLTQLQFRWKRKEPLSGFTCLQCFGYSKPDDVPTYTITKSNNIESNYYAFFAIAQSCDPTTFDLLMNLKKENELLQQRLNQLTSSLQSSSNDGSPTNYQQNGDSPSSFGSSSCQLPSVIASWMQSGWHQSNNPWMSRASNAGSKSERESSLLSSRTTTHEDTATPFDSSNLHNEEESKKRKKKIYVTMENYQCADCGSTNSPEWRKGPLGPKTLCNACGLRWAKKNKKVRTIGQLSNME